MNIARRPTGAGITCKNAKTDTDRNGKRAMGATMSVHRDNETKTR